MSATATAPPPAMPPAARRSRLPIVAGILIVLVALLAAAMFLYDHSRRDQIAKGVTIDGVDVGGLSQAAARRKVQSDLISRLSEPVRIHSGSRTWTLSARQAAVTVDADNMVAQAIGASREGSIFTRTIRGLSGGSVHRNVPLVVELLAQGRSAGDRAKCGPPSTARRATHRCRRPRAASAPCRRSPA